MTKYVALLRGIGPSNPNMRGAKLVEAVHAAGFKNAKSLLASGNVIFESNIKDQTKIETVLEKTWPTRLSFNSTTIVRSQAQLQALVDADPYRGAVHSNKNTYLLVTFFKAAPKDLKDNYYDMLEVNALCSSLDMDGPGTPDFMAKLDKQFGGKTNITSRTWLTVQRILKKME